MPKFSANLSFLYPDLPFLDRFEAAARDGFKAVEYVGPYDHPPELIAELLQQHGLVQALFNLPAGNWAAGERGIGCHPDRVDEFRAGVATAIRYGTALGCIRINCLAGLAPAGIDRQALHWTLVENLKYAAQCMAEAGIKLLLEPINRRDMPDFFVSTTDHAQHIMAAVNSSNLYLQYDIYHMQVMQGDLIPTFIRLKDQIAHIQIADTPGRHEPGSGEINYAFILPELDRRGYDGWVGCEYRPKAGTSEGLGWMKSYLQA
ncbi:2-oxo-tetronate isomerase [Devosia sp. SL43]|uniref:2-oxo-tetronate isomerase n=1 Tax=Devosia sp. SL43 TaxID=2806348 RepID=UPI001F1EEF05|nr:2-oxo-tetronate isomerase [Devosia sp. SL43]UJW84931.1 hydroxypyruvate isomerase [Devosia sp. SL43]